MHLLAWFVISHSYYHIIRIAYSWQKLLSQESKCLLDSVHFSGLTLLLATRWHWHWHWHPRSGVVYNFGRVCLPVCLYGLFMYVCMSDDNFRKPQHRKFIFLHTVYLQGIRAKFVYEGHRVKVKVTVAKTVENPFFHSPRRSVTPAP